MIACLYIGHVRKSALCPVAQHAMIAAASNLGLDSAVGVNGDSIVSVKIAWAYQM
jgi:hypothetical protein